MPNTSDSGAVYILDHKGNELGIITASDAATEDYFGRQVEVGPTKIVVGAAWNDDDGERSGSAYLYDHKGENEIKLTASDADSYDYFGYGVGIGGTIVVVGAMYADEPSNSGAAYIFDLDGNQLGIITASDGGSDDYFGRVLAVGPTKIVIGAYQDDDNGTNAGAVYVYDHKGNNEVKITASDGAAGDEFGNLAIAVNDKYIAVSAAADDDDGSGSGAAYIYDLDGTNEVKITASDAAANDNFGYKVGIGGTIIVVGAPFKNSSTGAAYIFDLSGNQLGILTGSDSAASDRYGFSVGVGTDKIVIGAYDHHTDGNSDQGQAYIYDHKGANEVKITGSDSVAGDQFGFAVGIGATVIVVGANEAHIKGIDGVGKAYIFDLSGTQLGIITASDGALQDRFGNDIGVGTSKIVIGASQDNTGGAGYDEGSAYIYDIDGTNEVKITASDPSSQAYFGSKVDISGDKIVVGSYHADDGSTSDTGAAYIFDLSGNELGKLLASDRAAGDEFSGLFVSIESDQVLVGAWQDDSAKGSAYLFDVSGKSYIENKTGDLIIESIDTDGGSGANVIINAGTGKTSIVANVNGSVELWNNGSKKLETISTGATVTGDLYATTLHSNDIDVTGIITGTSLNLGGSASLIREVKLGGSQDLLVHHSKTNISETFKIVASDGATGDEFGRGGAIGTSKFVVGATKDDDDGSGSGAAYIYDLDGTNEVKITASDAAANDNFGYKVGIGGTIIVVGAPFKNSSTGAAYIFDLSGNQLGILTGSDSAASDRYGFSVGVGTDKIVIGAYDHHTDGNSDQGQAYIYDHKGANEVKITGSDSVAGDQFGFAVGIGATVIVVGANEAHIKGIDGVGKAYIFDLSGTQLGIITASDGALQDRFGNDIGVGTSKIVIGASQDNTGGAGYDEGSAYIYDIDGTNEVKITASDPSSQAYFGSKVDISGDKIVVGSYHADDGSTSDTGAAYIFDLSGNELGKLLASDRAAGDEFSGLFVSIESDQVLVGAWQDDSAKGSAYLFDVSGKSYIENKTGDLIIESIDTDGGSGANVIINAGTGKTSIVANVNGSVELWNNGSKKLETISTGATVTGDLYATTLYGSGANLTGLTGASAATYGSTGSTPVIIVDANGRITGISTVTTTGSGGGIAQVADDTSPSLGGNLDLNSKFITGSGGVSVSGVVTATSFVGDITGDVTGNADTATTSTNFTVTANNTTDETVYPVFVDGATGTQGAETDTGLSYNPNSGTLTATTFSGSGSSLTGLTGASAATYGNTAATPVIVVDANGRITGISTAAISGGGGGGSIGIRSDGTVIQSSASNLNFIGTGITMADDGSVTDITIPTVQRTPTRIVASGGQTAFTVASYNSNQIDVYLNGAKLDSTEFTETNSTTITLTTGASANDVFESIGFSNYTGVNVTSANSATDATNAANVTVADESSDTTCFPLFVTAATGDLPPRTDASALTYDASNGTLSATTFSGSLTGNVTGDVTGDVTGTATTATNVTVADESSDTTCFPLFVTTHPGDGSGDYPPKLDAGFTYNASAGILGATTFQGNLDLSGLLKEGVNITAGKLSANTNIDLANGMVHLFTTTESTTSTPNIRVDGSTSLDSSMSTGESTTVVIISAAAAAGYSAELTIDGSAVTESWLGGSAPSEGGSSGYDVYTYNIIKTGSATFVVLANLVNFA